MHVQRIPPGATQDLRHRVLRVGKPLHTCLWQGDELPTTLHFGLMNDGQRPLAIVSYFLASPPWRGAEPAWQLRGMAVEPGLQRQGLGAALVRGSIPLLCGGGADVAVHLIWCNARTSAAGFYLGEGFVQVGEIFEIEGIGPHVRMERAL